MTEHILNFAIAIDDEGIVRGIREKAEKKIINQLAEGVLNSMFKSAYNNYYNDKATETDRNGDIRLKKTDEIAFRECAKDIVQETLSDNKDAIIEKAAEILAESYKKTKAWKDKTKEVLE